MAIGYINSDTSKLKINNTFEFEAILNEPILKREPVGIGLKDMTQLSNPSGLPTLISYLSFSPDSNYLAMASTSASSDYLYIYKIENDILTKITTIDILPSENVLHLSWSPDSIYLAITRSVSPYFNVYKRTGDNFVKLANADVLPTGAAGGVGFDNNTGEYLSVGAGSKNVYFYKRTGDSFTKLADPSVLPPANGKFNAFDYTGEYVAMVHASGIYLTIYSRSGDVFTKVENPLPYPGSIAQDLCWTKNSQLLCLARGDDTNESMIYINKNGVFSEIGQVNDRSVMGADFILSKYFIETASTVPFINIYIRFGDVMFDKTPTFTQPSVYPRIIKVSNNLKYVACTHSSSSPYLTLYKLNFTANKTTQTNYSKYDMYGYAKEDGVTNDLKSFIITHIDE